MKETNYVMVKFLMLYWVIFVFIFCSGLNAAEISRDAKRHMARGMAAMEEAKDATDYQDAIAEFKKAIEYAPDWSDAWFNLGVAQEKAANYADAINSCNKYLELNPVAADSSEVEDRIFKLEYKQEKAAKEKQETIRRVEKAEKPWTEKLKGKWTGVGYPYWDKTGQVYHPGNIYSVRVTGKQIEIKMISYGLGPPDGSIVRIPLNKVIFRGSIERKCIKGTYYDLSISTTFSRSGVLLKKTVSIYRESSVDGPINLRPNGELHMPDPLGKWKRVR